MERLMSAVCKRVEIVKNIADERQRKRVVVYVTVRVIRPLFPSATISTCRSKRTEYKYSKLIIFT